MKLFKKFLENELCYPYLDGTSAFEFEIALYRRMIKTIKNIWLCITNKKCKCCRKKYAKYYAPWAEGDYCSDKCENDFISGN